MLLAGFAHPRDHCLGCLLFNLGCVQRQIPGFRASRIHGGEVGVHKRDRSATASRKIASNIGGMLSPIASPQNVVAISIMKPAPTWGQWFYIVIPVGIISLLLIWVLLLVSFQPGKGTVIVPIRPVHDKFTAGQYFVAAVTIGTIALTFLAPVVADFAVGFGPPEYVALMAVAATAGVLLLSAGVTAFSLFGGDLLRAWGAG